MKPPYALTLAIGYFLLAIPPAFSQTPVLTGQCTGGPLTVTSSPTAARIEWIRNGSIIEKANELQLGNATVVAGQEGVMGSDNAHLLHPKKIQVTAAGDVYVVDWGNGRVQKWSPPYTSGTTVASGMDWPDDVQVENGNTILVSEHWGRRISRWPGNTTIATIGSGADGLCFDPSGRLLAVEFWNGTIARFPANPTASSPKTIVAGTSSTGGALNQLNFPTDVVTDASGRIYVMDSDNGRIIRFPSNSSQGTNGVEVVSGLNIRYNCAISVDPQGNIFFCSWEGIYIIGTWDGTPRKISDMGSYGIQPFANNQLFVTNDQAVKRMSILPPSNTFVPTTPGTYTARIYYRDGSVQTSNAVNVLLTPAPPVLAGSTSLCPGNTLTLSATSPVPGAVYQWTGPQGFSAAGATVTRPAVTLAHSGEYLATVRDASGCVSVPDTIRVKVEQPVPAVSIAATTGRFFCPGAPVTFSATPTNGGTTPTYEWRRNGTTIGTGSSLTMASINNGDVFTCTMISNAPCASPNTVTSLPLTMTASAEPVLQAAANCLGTTITMNSPIPLQNMAWYKDGVYVEDAPNLLNAVIIAGGNGAGAQTNQFGVPQDMTRDAAGNFYVVDKGNFRVLRFPPNSTQATMGTVVAGGNGQGTALNQLYDPVGVCVDAAFNLYVADGHGNRVLKFPPGSTSATYGTIVAGNGTTGFDLNQVNRPSRIQVDAAGNLYVLDYLRYRIMRFPPGSTAGTYGVVVAGGNGAGSGLNQLNYLNSMYVDAAGNVYCGDGNPTQAGRVMKWAPGATEGVLVAGGNGWGSGLNQFNSINYIHVMPNGDMYIVENSGNRVLKWPAGATSGILVAGGNQADPNNRLNYPNDVWVGADEKVYVLDQYHYRLIRIDPVLDIQYTPATAGTWKAIGTTQGGCPATTNEIIIHPVNTPAITISTPATMICAGTPVTFTTTATDAGTAPRYQWKINGVNVDTGAQYTPVAPLRNGDAITCELTVDADAGCVTANAVASNVITMTVNPTMQISIVANSPGPVCPGSTPVFTATATGTPTPAYQWQVNGSNAGGNSATFSPATPHNGDVITCTLTGVTGCPAANTVTSNAIVPVVYTASDTILQVNKQVSGGDQTGLGWNNAFTELSDALAIAAACNNIREIWVAGGIYRTQYDASGQVPANQRLASFPIRSGLRIYGGLHTGYSSTNTADLSTVHNRNYAIAASDTSYLDGTLPGGNAYHVVTLQNTAAGTLLHGLVVSNGNANGNPGPLENVGAGLFAREAIAAITHCTFRNNSAWVGGGIYQRDLSNIRYEHCRFENNTATNYGAASSGINNAPAPAFTTFDHCLFAGNTAGLQGGGLNGVGHISVTMTNSLVYNNHANNGGGAWVFNTNQVASQVINNTFYGNTAGGGNASTIQHNSGTVNFHNNIVMGLGNPITSTGDFTSTNSVTPARTPANESLWFQSVTPDHPDFLRLTNCAPAINAASNAAYGPDLAAASDFAGNPRLQQGTIDQGAFESAATPLTITLQPVPAIVCTPVDTSFSLLAASNATISYQWQVDKNDGNGFTNIGGANNPTYPVMQPTTTQNGWRYRAYASHCPFAADTTAAVPLTVNALPAMQPITGALQLCEGKTTQLANTTTAASYSWKSLDAATATISTTGSVQGLQPGTAIMRYIATTAAGCIDSISSTVTVHALPIVQPITGMQRLCANSSLQLANATAGVTGYWKSTNPLAAQVDPATGRLTGVGAGTTTIRYIATNANGCQDSVATLINVDALPPVQAIVSATNDFKLCEQATLQLNNTTAANSSSWKILDNTIASITTGGRVSGLLAGVTTARFIAVGINGTGCTDSADRAITIMPLQPTAINIAASSTEICDGTEVIFTAQSTNGGNSPAYQWMLNNQPTGNTGTWRTHTLQAGDIISCVLQSNAACAAPAILPSGTITMTVHPLPVVNPHAGKEAIYKGDQLFLQAGISSDVVQLKWSPVTGLSNDTIAAPLARPMITTLYQVAATTQYGCTATGYLEITVLEPQDIPNAFSPNGDGINDRWEIRSLEKFPQATIQIFNRYGQPLYKTNGYQPGKGWDGRLNGQPLPMGTYYYIIDLKNGFEPLSGSISIVK